MSLNLAFILVMSFYSGTDDEYNNLVAGTKGTWKYFHRLNKSEAVCLISRITGVGDCKKILKCVSSSDKVLDKVLLLFISRV